MEQSDLARELLMAGGKASPIAVTLVVAKVSGWGPQDWAYVFAGGYALLQFGYLLWKWRCEVSDRRKKGASNG